MQEDEGRHDATEAEREPLVQGAFATLLVHDGVEGQSQAKQGSQILEEAGKGCGVNVDPFWPLTPLLGFLESPQEVDTQPLEQQIKSNGKTEQEEGDEEIFLETGIVDALIVAESFSNCNT